MKPQECICWGLVSYDIVAGCWKPLLGLSMLGRESAFDQYIVHINFHITINQRENILFINLW